MMTNKKDKNVKEPKVDKYREKLDSLIEKYNTLRKRNEALTNDLNLVRTEMQKTLGAAEALSELLEVGLGVANDD